MHALIFRPCLERTVSQQFKAVFFMRQLWLTHFLIGRWKVMENYKKPYLELFNEITNVIEELQRIQQKAEQLFIEGDEEEN